MLLDKKRLRGNVTLTTVIIAGAILVTAGLTVLVNAIDITFSSKSYHERILGEVALTACFEEGMSKISRVVSYVGSDAIVLPDGWSCDVVVTNDGVNPNLKILTISAMSDDYTISRVKKVDTATSPYTLINE